MQYIRQPSTAPFYAAFALVVSLLSACGGSDSATSTSATSASSAETTSSTSGSGTTSGSSSGAPGSVTLNWEAPTENTNGTEASQLIGYYIYYGTNPDSLDQWVVAWGANTTSYTVTDLSPGTYYFSVAAYNWLGVESTPSAVVSTTI